MIITRNALYEWSKLKSEVVTQIRSGSLFEYEWVSLSHCIVNIVSISPVTKEHTRPVQTSIKSVPSLWSILGKFWLYLSLGLPQRLKCKGPTKALIDGLSSFFMALWDSSITDHKISIYSEVGKFVL